VLVVVLMLIELVTWAVIGETHLLIDVDGGDLGGLVTVLGNGVLFIGLMAYKRIDYRELFHPARSSVSATLGVVTVPILLMVPGLVTLAGALNSIVMWLFPMSVEDQAMFADMMSASTLAVLFACVAAPVLEEMLFRGVILRSFLRQYSRTRAILASSVIFGLAHLNVYQLATAFAIGIIAGWLYERCRSLWPCIVLHAAYNGIVTYLHNTTISDEAAMGDTAAYTAVVFAAAIAGGLLLLRLLGTRATQRSSSDR
ncbi:MAG TPA: type II CAAX endopeptidase family protein, partial [Povalibacter sp.]